MRLRSLLYVPAHSDRFLAKAHERGADAIILDLEDAVPEVDKDRARDGLADAAKAVSRNGAKVFVRINSGERRRADAEAATRAGATGLVLAKAELAELGSFALPAIAMLESPGAVLDAREYAKHPGVIGLLVGSEDLATELAEDGNPWRLRIVGALDVLPATTATTLKAAQEKTRDRSGGVEVNMAVGYGGRREITDAMRSIVASHHADGRSLEDLAESLTPDLIGEHLYTGGQPDPDLVIRTSGEQRLSDFMLWQAAHSEFYFVEALGPDLREVDFLRAVRDYTKRHRRFGG